MPAATQISAFVSAETKAEIERYTRATGVKQNHLVEEALRHHLQALHALPADIVVRPRIVVSPEAGAAIARRRKPTAKLKALMARDDD